MDHEKNRTMQTGSQAIKCKSIEACTFLFEPIKLFFTSDYATYNFFFQICSVLKGALKLNKHAMAKSDYNVTGPVKAITAVNFYRSMMGRVLIRASRN